MVPLYTEVSSFQQVRIDVYRSVLILGSWNKMVPLHTVVCVGFTVLVNISNRIWSLTFLLVLSEGLPQDLYMALVKVHSSTLSSFQRRQLATGYRASVS